MLNLFGPLLGDAAARLEQALDPTRLAIAIAAAGIAVTGLIFIEIGVRDLLTPSLGPGGAGVATGVTFVLIAALVLLAIRRPPRRLPPAALPVQPASSDLGMAELARKRPLASLAIAFALGALDGLMEGRRRR